MELVRKATAAAAPRALAGIAIAFALGWGVAWQWAPDLEQGSPRFLLVRLETGSESELISRPRLTSGEPFRVRVELSAPGQVRVYARDASGWQRLLFDEADREYPYGMEVVLPGSGAGDAFLLSPDRHTGDLLLLALTGPVDPYLDEVLAFEADAPAERLQAELPGNPAAVIVAADRLPG